MRSGLRSVVRKWRGDDLIVDVAAHDLSVGPGLCVGLFVWLVADGAQRGL